MWTGTPVLDSATHPILSKDFDQPTSVAACAALGLQGFTGWRLPSLAELNTAIVDTWTEGYARAEGIDKDGFGRMGADLSRPTGPTTEKSLKFTSARPFFIWTSTVGRVPQDFMVIWLDREPLSKNAHTKTLGFQTYCVRTMEPELAEIARQSAPGVPVHDEAELRAFVAVHRSYDALGKGNVAAATDAAQQAITTAPNSVYGFLALAQAQMFSGQWDAAITQLTTAKKLDKNNGFIKDNLALAEANRRKSRSTPAITQVYNEQVIADAALNRKDYQTAADAATIVTQLQPKSIAGLRTLGFAQAGLEHWPEAVKTLEAATLAAHLGPGGDPELEDQLNTAKAMAKAMKKSQTKGSTP